MIKKIAAEFDEYHIAGKETKMKKLICMAICGAYFFTSTACMAFEAQCLNSNGKFSDCTAEINDGKLSVHYDGKKWQGLDKTIMGNQITSLSGGEYARRRVGESIGAAVLLGPLFLFMLFSKKKRDNFGIEYMTENGNKDAMLVQMKKKYGFAFGQQLKAISGKEIQMEGAGEPKKENKAQPVTADQKSESPAINPQVSAENAQGDSAPAATVEAAVTEQQAAATESDTQTIGNAAKDANPNGTYATKRKHK